MSSEFRSPLSGGRDRSSIIRAASLRLRRAALIAAAFAAASCTDRIPSGIDGTPQRGRAALAVQPAFARIPEGGPQIRLQRVEGVLTGPSGERFTAVAIFEGDSAVLVFDVTLSGLATNFDLDLAAYDENGELAFTAHLEDVRVTPGSEPVIAAPTFVYAASDAGVATIDVAPGSVSLTAGGTAQLAVTGVDAGNQPISPVRVGWTSRNPAVAMVDADGFVAAGNLHGSAWIVARTPMDVADSVLVTVQGVVSTVSIVPASINLVIGQLRTLAAEARDAAGTLVPGRVATWSTSNDVVARINATTGVVEAASNGTVTVTATVDGRSGTASVFVGSPVLRIDLSPTAHSFGAIGQTQAFTATVVPRTGQSVTGIPVTWAIEPQSVATVSPEGVVTARANGTATLTATADGVTRTATITVAQTAHTVRITPRDVVLTSRNATAEFQATVVDANNTPVPGTVVWSLSNPAVGTISQTGSFRGQAYGSTDVIATSGQTVDRVSVEIRRTVTELVIQTTGPALGLGESMQLAVIATDAEGASFDPGPVTWATSDATILDVTASGLATGVSSGTATVTATAGGRVATATFTVGGGGGAAGILAGRVINGQTGTGIAGATVSADGMTVTTTAGGNFTIGPVNAGSTLAVSASGFVSTQYFDTPVQGGGTTSIGDLPLAPSNLFNGTLSGTVRDAVSAEGIGGAGVVARSGINATSGAIVGQTTADGEGDYVLSLPAGTYTLTASAATYSTGTHVTVAIGGQTRTNQNPVLVPVGNGNEIRIVLSWGANPRDLDSHLTGPDGAGGGFHVYYGNTVARDGLNNILAQLDQDVTGGFGPETITIPSQIAGTYRYNVHHFSGSSSISASGATVRVFRGGTQIGSFSPPADQGAGDDDVWTVFELNGTTLTAINVITAEGNVNGAARAGAARAASVARDATAVRAAAAANPKRRD